MSKSVFLRNSLKPSEDKMEETKPNVVNIEKRMTLLIHGIGAMSTFIEYMYIKSEKNPKLFEIMEELGLDQNNMEQRFIEEFTKYGTAGEA